VDVITDYKANVPYSVWQNRWSMVTETAKASNINQQQQGHEYKTEMHYHNHNKQASLAGKKPQNENDTKQSSQQNLC